jgi:hypothetical protein
MEVNGQVDAGPFFTGKNLRYSMDKRIGGPQSQFHAMEEGEIF